jgi:signal transduction histidine kinase
MSVSVKMMQDDKKDLAVIKQVDHSLMNIENDIFYSERNPYNLIFNHISIPIILSTRDTWDIIECNDAAVIFFKYSKEELIKIDFFDLFPKEQAQKVRNKFLDYNLNAQNRIIVMDKRGERVKVNLFTDISIFKGKEVIISNFIQQLSDDPRDSIQEKNQENINIIKKQLWQSQKIEAIGTFTRGIAHDFNNILSTIIGFAELTRQQLRNDPKLYGHLNNILSASNKAKGLISQIMTFAKTTEHKFYPMKISPVIEKVIRIIRPSIPRTIQIRFYSNVSGDYIKADKIQFKQVIMNLLTNAAQAIKDKSRGIINIELTKTNIIRHISPEHYQMQSGDYLKMSVSDTGCGMSGEIKDRIFEPYFTTHGLGDGTGLGLAITYGIIQNLRGGITVRSRMGKGTTFVVFIPEFKNKEAS